MIVIMNRECMRMCTCTGMWRTMVHADSPCDCGGDFKRFRRVLQEYVLPHMFVSARALPDPETVVLHVRSGDVMRTKRGVKYW